MSVRDMRGFTIVECLVALLILSVGLIGAAGLQATLAKSSSGGDARMRAVALATELHGRMVGDYANLSCYAYPATACAVPATSQAMTDWVTAVHTLPGSLDPVVAQDANGLWTIRVQWSMPQDTAANTRGAPLVSAYQLAFKVDTTQ